MLDQIRLWADIYRKCNTFFVVDEDRYYAPRARTSEVDALSVCEAVSALYFIRLWLILGRVYCVYQSLERVSAGHLGTNHF